jgi:predicted N-acyltransferase
LISDGEAPGEHHAASDDGSGSTSDQYCAATATAALELSFVPSIASIGEQAWSQLRGSDQPFLSYAFLEALESSGCVSEETGWVPQHVVLRDAQGCLRAAMPAYLKYHSWGEFVFDWAWADAYRRHGLDYYPKLVCAVPFTPVTGQRVLLADSDRGTGAELHRPGTGTGGLRGPALATALLDRLADAVTQLDVSSFHLLFPDDATREAMQGARGWLLRKDCQFHWHNRGYDTFADYLATFASAKRKKVKRERRRIAEAGIHFDWLAGGEIDEVTWGDIYRFYSSTFLKRGHSPYFDLSLMQLLGQRLSDQMSVCLARRGELAVACAVFFHDSNTLYGRYWGCEEEFNSLHFETCYYQGIEFCIERGLQRFEPGTQGEHKLSRGFEPTTTWSGHVIGEPAFASAIADYLARERTGVDAYMDAAADHLPFRQPDADPP